jgi:alkanesulfonate monooxygenase SsuD/methylene tetrahydromethanopterin reductase-like flavin-dependent oxidoreductase (luciferase family)
MQFGIFSFMNCATSERMAGHVIPPKRMSRESWQTASNFHLNFMEMADDLGFDWVGVAEHHYGTAMTPNPIVAAAALSQRIRNAKIAVFGPILPLLNPIRVAEELAMVDQLSGGRLLVGLLRGTPAEFLTYGTNPDESRAMFEEATDLLLRAWTEPEPFGWEGIYYRFRTVAVSPRVLQDPHPQMLMSGNSVDSLKFAAARHFDIGFSFANPEICGKHFALYQDEAGKAGWKPTAKNTLYRHYVYVAKSDAEAQEVNDRYGFWAGFGGRSLQSNSGKTPSANNDVIKDLTARTGHLAKTSAIDMSVPPIIGSPETVIKRIQEISHIGSIDRFDLVFSAGQLPAELSTASLKLFVSEVMPILHS